MRLNGLKELVDSLTIMGHHRTFHILKKLHELHVYMLPLFYLKFSAYYNISLNSI